MSCKLADVSTAYRNDPQLKKTDVETLSTWAEMQPHLPKLEELQIILFLNSCYYQIDRAKTTIEKYFRFRKTSSLFRDVTEELIRKTLASFFIGFMPRRTPQGDAVFFLRMLDKRPEAFHCEDYSKVVVAIITIYFHQFGPANGLVVVVDTRDVSLGHLYRMNLSVLRQLLYFVQEAAATRIKNIHSLHSNPIAQKLMGLVSSFLKKELHDIIKFHSHSMETFFEYVPRECFPEDYGGLLPASDVLHGIGVACVMNSFDSVFLEKNVEHILGSLEVLRWHEGQKIDEHGRMENQSGIFGSIRKIFR